ncbi:MULTISPECIES: hypothetical protein [Bifidobacterium]|uniref:Colicin transporter n=2 Tax=Bifidobacterium TaxID=1678 RepID=A0A261FNG7_9BIFI|nr:MULTISPECIES: hypothetical protein [Bifidobacterium]OZG60730.1 hypothetical protein BLEM_1699 [Bifidobacterium lemurum]OZG69628.1 hypothetical protein BEUL_0045 [Bifidobacterium eulemuris]QOL32257.1 hypothetical protein BE0216_07165 [Bifidobacterium eulemuris]QOL35217.1 hypothetical protein BL8807_05030 [Bifidobacterium lemurum]
MTNEKNMEPEETPSVVEDVAAGFVAHGLADGAKAGTAETGSAPDPKRPKWLILAIAAACVVVVAAAGIGGWAAWHHAQLSEAKSVCAEASDTVRVAMNKYNALLNGDAADAVETSEDAVADAAVLSDLADAIDAEAPEYAGCTATDKIGLDEATASLADASGWYESHTKSLQTAVDAVNASVLDKTVSDARTLLDSTDGKVTDNATREALKTAIGERDADAIAKAVKGVNDSIKAKEEADRKAQEEAEAAAAQAQAEAEAAAQAQQQAQQYYQQSYTPSYSYTPTYSGGGSSGSSSGGSSGGPVSGGHGCTTDCGTLPDYGVIIH